MTLTKVDPATMKKTRPQDNPYEIWKFGDWEWRVLKKYTKDESDPYARAFCAVNSPFTFGSPDLGDVYVREYESVARLVAVNP
jgi:hypothetical protein